MKAIKALLMLAALSMPLVAFALEGDEQVEYTDAIGAGNMKVVKKYLDAKKVEIDEKFFAWSGLQIAANKNQLGMVKFFAENGADINYRHPVTKMTALNLAAYDDHEDIVKYLLSKGADPNIKMRGGVSILKAVKDIGNTKMAELLEAAGAKEE